MTLHVICPVCENGELRPDPRVVRCSGCSYTPGWDFFATLRAIRALPETRRLPEAGSSCPACGAETRAGEEGQGRRTVPPGEEG